MTVLFCDLTGSTALGESLDPERLRALLARYFEQMKAIVERHGGSVEKFIGDAVMAVFGVPVLHEDDALRAVRAAVDMRDALPELGLRGRIGVMTGEVVTGTEERLATGDAVNVAARLEQAAQPGQVLVGEPTLALVRDAAEVEPIDPLELKGKTDPVLAYRLLQVRDAPERRHGEQFVGRDLELRILGDAWERVRSEQRCELVTVIGDAGVGKSRLASEALSSVDATVVRARCLPYGDGITYWPVVEVLKQLDLQPAEEAAAVAIRSLLGETEVATIGGGDRMGVPQDAGAGCGRAAAGGRLRRHPVGRADIPGSGRTRSAPVGGRIDPAAMHGAAGARRAAAPPGQSRSVSSHSATRTSTSSYRRRSPPSCAETITRAAGGNPLFIEEMLAMASEAEGDLTVPPTLRALLGTRLDQLDTAERSVLERGAIEGEIFHRGAVQALAPVETQVTPRLAALVRKALIRPDKTQLAGEDAFRFRHLLIRDAAYDALPKATRADLHQRFALWLEQHGAELVELDEVLGYHLEQACRYRAELGTGEDGILAASARLHLAAGGRRAAVRQDYPAATTLLERAAALAPPGELDLAVECDLIDARYWGGDAGSALSRAESLAESGAAAGDGVAELCGRIKAGFIRLYLEPEGAGTERLAALVEEALPVFQSAATTWACTRRMTHAWGGVPSRAHGRGAEAYERAAVHARQAGRPRRGIGVPRPLPPRRYDARSGNYWCGLTSPSSERGGTTTSVVSGGSAGYARPLRRGAGDPRRSARGVGRTRRQTPTRVHHRH